MGVSRWPGVCGPPPRSDVREYFIDANTGAVALEFSVRKTQSAVGRATGVLGDSKKISVTPNAGRFLADDSLRPPAITTYDLRGDFNRALDIINGFVTPTINDIASDTDNVWTDGAAGDAHIYSGWTYDYYFKRSAAAASTTPISPFAASCTRFAARISTRRSTSSPTSS